ncbi:MAG TPA: CBS domain-containing protein [Thermoanaerobaculia bacterium]|jgi:CBS domain-containing protein|nr:CBS domain-containing protein [Thermoanaerobaculia bacterium]
MKAADLMTPRPACCFADTNLVDVTQMFVVHDAGAIPVVDRTTGRPIGIVTDRDVATRAVASGTDARKLTAGDCMTTSVVTVPLDADFDEVLDAMSENQVRRLIVVDDHGGVAGIIAQADVALHGRDKKSGELVKEVSKPEETSTATES